MDVYIHTHKHVLLICMHAYVHTCVHDKVCVYVMHICIPCIRIRTYIYVSIKVLCTYVFNLIGVIMYACVVQNSKTRSKYIREITNYMNKRAQIGILFIHVFTIECMRTCIYT